MRYKILYIVFSMFVFLACNNSTRQSKDELKPDINLTQLKEYFGTNEIHDSFSNRVFYLNIINPKFKFGTGMSLEKKVQDYSTEGALIFTNISKNIAVDSLLFKFEVDSTVINISYKYSDLKLIDENVQRSVEFLKRVNEKKYSEAKTYFDKSISENESQAMKIYEAINSLGSIEKFRFVKFKIQKDNVAILINAIYQTGDMNTYVLVFPLNNSGNSKIVGISTKA